MIIKNTDIPLPTSTENNWTAQVFFNQQIKKYAQKINELGIAVSDITTKFETTSIIDTYDASTEDRIISCNFPSGKTVTLSADTTVGHWYVLKDIGGLCSTRNITVDLNGFTLDGSGSDIVLNQNYSMLFIVCTSPGVYSLIFNSCYLGSTSIVTLGTITTGVWHGTKVSEVYGGTNQDSYAVGDILYASATNTLLKLAGNITTTKKFLRSTGNGTDATAPVWDTIVNGDLPNDISVQTLTATKNDTNIVSAFTGSYAANYTGVRIQNTSNTGIGSLEILDPLSGTKKGVLMYFNGSHLSFPDQFSIGTLGSAQFNLIQSGIDMVTFNTSGNMIINTSCIANKASIAFPITSKANYTGAGGLNVQNVTTSQSTQIKLDDGSGGSYGFISVFGSTHATVANKFWFGTSGSYSVSVLTGNAIRQTWDQSGNCQYSFGVLTHTTAATSGYAHNIQVDSSTTGGGLGIISNSADVSARGLLKVHNDHTSAVGAYLIKLIQDAVISTNFKSYIDFDGTKLYKSNNTTPSGNLTGMKGDICLYGNDGLIYYCTTDSSTTWKACNAA